MPEENKFGVLMHSCLALMNIALLLFGSLAAGVIITMQCGYNDKYWILPFAGSMMIVITNTRREVPKWYEERWPKVVFYAAICIAIASYSAEYYDKYW